MKKIIAWSVLGCLIFVFGFLSGSFWSTMKFFSSFPKVSHEMGTGGDFTSSHDMDSDFYEAVFWGGSFKRTEELERLPEGDARLRVRFTYDQKTAAGVRFLLALNGKFRTAMLTTDAGGEAEVPMPFGRWRLNRLECRNWTGKPEGRFLLVSGDDAKLGETAFNRLFFTFREEGRTVSLSEDKDPTYTLEIQIRNRFKMVWPLPDSRKQEATIDRSVIQWDPYPRATSYVVKISHVTRESERSTTFSPIIYRQVDGVNSLALAQLPHAENDARPEEYSVEIRAYDQTGSFLSETEHSFATFSLTDKHVLVEYDQSEGMSIDQKDVERRFKAQQALDAAEFLIKNGMFPEARKLLGQSGPSALPGQAALINGYLYAAQGQCEEAGKYFKAAVDLGETCIPDSYRMGCSAE